MASGGPDRVIGRQFGITHVSVGRHRREHLVKPMQAAVERGDPLAIVKLDAIANDISRIVQRLDGLASEAAAAANEALK
jgi:hypothetical protein